MGHWLSDLHRFQPPHHRPPHIVTIRRPGVPPALVWAAVILAWVSGFLSAALWQMAST